MLRAATGDRERTNPAWERAVRDELQRLLASSAFSASKRCSRFLQYTVEQTLRGRSGTELKERTLGVEIFGLAPDFDPAENAMVRVTANEVRKKLAQCYTEGGPEHEVRIDLPLGSYAAEFIPVKREQAAPTAQKAARATRSWIPWALAVAVPICVFIYYGLTRSAAATAPIDAFWDPLVKSAKPVLVCLSNPVAYVPDRQIVKKYLSTLTPEARLEPFVVPPGEIPRESLVAVTDQLAGVGDAHAAIAFCSYFASRHKPYQVRIGVGTSFADLRDAPAILIGAYSNRWTREMTGQLRFVFDMIDLENAVRENNEPSRRWVLRGMSSDWKAPEDYAIISRILDSKTGQLLTCAGGLTNYGTQAAGEFLSNPVYLERAMRNAPSDWPSKNLQIVIRTKVIGTTPGPPEVIATHFW